MPRPDDAVSTVSLLTPPGEGGISVIQLAGPEAAAVLRRVFRLKGKTPAEQLEPSRIYYGTIVDESGAILDEVVVHPGREVVDINCHGGALVTRRVMDRLVALGARETQPPILPVQDGVQAEAWQALVTAATGLAAAVLLDQYHGALSRRAGELIDRMEAGRAGEAARELDALLSTARVGLRLTRPPRLAIAGRPNVGKSSLLNALVGRPRALVHEAPGTTRDYLDTTVAVEGLPVVLLDTAGIRRPGDAIEQAGVQRAIEQIDRADLILALFDGSEPIQSADRLLAQGLRGRRVIPVINKIDLSPRLAEMEVVELVGRVPSRLSALTGDGLEALGRRVTAELFGPLPVPGSAVVFTIRQREVLSRARRALDTDPAGAAMILKGLTAEPACGS